MRMDMRPSTEPTLHRTQAGDRRMLEGLRRGLRILMGEPPDPTDPPTPYDLQASMAERRAKLIRREMLHDSHGYPWLPTNRAIRRLPDEGDGSYTARTPVPLPPRAS